LNDLRKLTPEEIHCPKCQGGKRMEEALKYRVWRKDEESLPCEKCGSLIYRYATTEPSVEQRYPPRHIKEDIIEYFCENGHSNIVVDEAFKQDKT